MISVPSIHGNKWGKNGNSDSFYFLGTWNIRSMNQGKMEVVKQEMATVNIDMLGISELKRTGVGEFN